MKSILFSLIGLVIGFASVAQGARIECANADASVRLSVSPLEKINSVGDTHLAVMKTSDPAGRYVGVRFLPLANGLALVSFPGVNIARNLTLNLPGFSSSQSEYPGSVLTTKFVVYDEIKQKDGSVWKVPREEERSYELSCKTEGSITYVSPCASKSKSDINQSLITAAQSADLNSVEQSLSCGADVNAAQDNGCTPLLSATEAPQRFCRPTIKWPRLDSYFSSRSSHIVRLLLDRGAYFDTAESASGETALHKAIQFAQAADVEQLITLDVDLNAQDNAGLSPLMVAAAGGYATAVERLVKAGADITLVSAENKTAFDVGTRLPEATRELLVPVSKEILIKGDQAGNCSPLSVEVPKSERVRLVFESVGTNMFTLASQAASVDMMIGAGKRDQKVIQFASPGKYPFQCGVHGGKQNNGEFIVK